MEYWLVPCSPGIYDAEGAFDEYGSVVWHQDCNMNPGDYVFIYVTAPVKEIRCKCKIECVDIPVDIGTDEGYTIDDTFFSRTYRRYMKLRLISKYNCPFLEFQFLLMNGLSGTIRSQRRASDKLVMYVETITKDNADNT